MSRIRRRCYATSVGRAIAFGCATRCHLSVHSLAGAGSWGAGSWGGVAVDGGSVNAFLAAALTRVMRANVSIPALASASVSHSAAVGGSVAGVVRSL